MEEPQSPSDPRPNGEPYFIRTDCPDCSTDLELFDKIIWDNKVMFHDEWMCPDCENGLYLDTPGKDREDAA